MMDCFCSGGRCWCCWTGTGGIIQKAEKVQKSQQGDAQTQARPRRGMFNMAPRLAHTQVQLALFDAQQPSTLIVINARWLHHFPIDYAYMPLLLDNALAVFRKSTHSYATVGTVRFHPRSTKAGPQLAFSLASCGIARLSSAWPDSLMS
jgi:hypothetical protein